MIGKRKKRYARVLADNVLVIDATEREMALVRKGRLGIEKVKSTPRYEVYRIRK